MVRDDDVAAMAATIAALRAEVDALRAEVDAALRDRRTFSVAGALVQHVEVEDDEGVIVSYGTLYDGARLYVFRQRNVRRAAESAAFWVDLDVVAAVDAPAEWLDALSRPQE